MCLGTYILIVTAYSIRLLKTLVKAGSVRIRTGVLSWLVVFTLFMTIFNYQAVFFSGFFSNRVGTGRIIVLVRGFIVLGLKGFKIIFLMQQVFFQKMLSWNRLKFVVSSRVISIVDWIYVSIANTLKFEAVVIIVGCLALFL